MKTVLLLIYLATFSMNAEEYYRYDPSSGLSKPLGDAKDAHPTEWQLWTFRPGEPIHAGSRPAGLFVFSSAEEAMKFLAFGKKAELEYTKLTGKEETGGSFFNSVCPVAIYKNADGENCQERQVAVGKLMELGKELYDLHEAYDTAKSLAGAEETSQVGSVFKEYAGQLETGLQLQAKLRAVLEVTLCSSIANLNRDFEELQKDIDVAQQNLPALSFSKPNGFSPVISNAPPMNLSNMLSHAVAPDDLPDPFKPSPAELAQTRSATPGVLDLNSSDSPASPDYARTMASQTVTALGALCSGIQANAGQIQRLQQELAKLEQEIRLLESKKTITLVDLRNSLYRGGSQGIEQKTWKYENGLNYPMAFILKQEGLYIGVDPDASGFYETHRSESTETPYTRILGVGDVERNGPINGPNNSWTVSIDQLAGEVIFGTQAEAQEFKQMLARNIQAAAHPLTQQDIDTKEREFDNSLANCRNKLDASQQTIAQIDAQDTESISQMRQGIRLWRAAVTFEETLLIQTSATEFHAAQDEIKKIEAKLADTRYEETRTMEPEKLAQRKKDEALWQSLLKQQRDRQQQAQQRVKQAIIRARAIKLTEFGQISSCPGTLNTRWLSPQDEMHYRPVSFREPDFNLGIEFKFGRLKSRDVSSDGVWPYSLPAVKQFIANFQATAPTVSLSEATGASLSEGNAHEDELLLQQVAIPVVPKQSSPDDLPLP